MTDADVRTYARDGYWVSPAPMLDAQEISVVRAAVDAAWQRAVQRAEQGLEGARDLAWTRVRPELPRLHLEDPVLAAFCQHRVFQDIALKLLGPDADLLWNQGHVKGPGGGERTAIPWHQDAAYARLECPPALSVWVALSPCHKDNGALAMAAGTHRDVVPHAWDNSLDYFTRPEPEQRELIEMEPGQIIVFDTQVAHGSGPNRTDQPRFAYSLSFTGPAARLLPGRTLFGDQLPVLRNGRCAADLLACRDDASSPLQPQALALWRELEARTARSHQRELDSRYLAFRESRKQQDDREARASFCELWRATDEDDAFVNGDLLSARSDPDAIVREVKDLTGENARDMAINLLKRALQLDPSHSAARQLLSRLS